MIGIGTLVNAGAVVVGTGIGLLCRKGLPERVSAIAKQAIGLAVIFIGAGGALAAAFRVSAQGGIKMEDTMLLIWSLVIGAVLGELMRLEDWMLRGGEALRKRFAKKADDRFAQGFTTATLVFCVGAMSVVGALEDGLSGNPETLFAKAVLDGMFALLLASSMGAGVGFSAVVVLGYQGLITALASTLRPLITDAVLGQMSMVGGALIFLIGVNILFEKKFKVGNMLPAAFIPVFWNIICGFFT